MTLEIETRCIHSLNHDEKQHPYGAVSIPIYQTQSLAIQESEKVKATIIQEKAILQGLI